jgi:hypothetical protein
MYVHSRAWSVPAPNQTTREHFLAKCRELIERDVRFSVGVVGLPEHTEEIEALRKELPEQVYLWINAYKRHPYTADELRRLSEIDPLFPLNTRHYPSQGHPCRAGHSFISVDGDGVVRRCHFIKTPIGNLYAADFELGNRSVIVGVIEACDPCSSLGTGAHGRRHPQRILSAS